MASIINTVAFKNFFNYYGNYEETRYDFKEGINIVVADNGAGKSKFFNAFLWLFYDQVLDSDDKIRKGVKDIAVKIISDKAKAETPIGESVETGIKIIYSTSRYKYRITKSFTATRIGEDITSSSSWQVIMNDVDVDETDLTLHKFKPVYEVDRKSVIINKLILPNLRQYSFFQGEEVDSIIDFSKKSSIEEAVRTLTDISDYEKLVAVTEYLKDSSEKDLKKQMKSKSDHNERLDIALKLKEDLDQSLKNEEARLKQYNSLYDEAEKEKELLDQNYSNAELRKELDDKIKDKNSKAKFVTDEYNSFLDGINNRFFDGNFSWISLGFENVESEFQEKIQTYREKHFEKKAIKNITDDPNKFFHFLPLDSPDAVSLKNMIDKEHCFVCDRPALKGTEPHNHFIRLRNRAVDDKKDVEFVKNNLTALFDGIQVNAQPFYNKISGIEDSVLKTREKETALSERVSKLKKEIKVLTGQRNDILIAGTEDEDAITIINRYKGAIKRIADSEYQINKIGEKIKHIKADISTTEKEIQSLKPTDIQEGYNLNYQICGDLFEATVNAKERVYNNMIALLEENANKHFQSLIKYNSLAGGILKFDKTPSDSIVFNYVDSSGNLVTGSSEGFQRMKKFSVVMAVISANTKEYNYPLLADAPISAFGEGFTEGFFESTGAVFPQSIILVKDLYKSSDNMKINDLGKKLITDTNVKTFYVNQVPENFEQVDLFTKNIRLK